MDAIALEERQLTEQLEAILPEVKKRRRRFFIASGAVLVGLLVLGVLRSLRPASMTPMEVYGALPLVLCFVCMAGMLILGWALEAVENRAREVKWKIRSLYEVDG
ncbi:MAG: hypothetical protein PHD04_00710 [Candidatus Pacebacteria bacterium]|nr:hypothetical protein [Candidatus Paceibacterota bacterium]